MEILESLMEELNALLPMPEENRRRLDQKIRLEFNYNSNHMEGNTLTYGETRQLLLFGRTSGDHDLREYEEMNGHDVAFEMIKLWAREPDRPLTEAGLRELHRILLVRPFWKEAQTNSGQLTRREIQIGAYKSYPNAVLLQNGEMFHYASPEETPLLMGELMQWLRDEEEKMELDIVELAAGFHYRFVRIHPFDDGNGRMARLLMNYILLKHNMPPVIIKSADKWNYLQALKAADSGNKQDFIDYVKMQLIWSVELYIKAAKRESLEEADDLEKEISIWKRAKKEKLVDGEVKRSTEAVLDVFYNGGIRSLFELYERKVAQFHDLFRDSHVSYWLNDQAKFESFNSFNLEMRGRLKELDAIKSVIILGDFHSFKLVPNPVIQFETRLTVTFETQTYVIIGADSMTITKGYEEVLSQEEQQNIVNPLVRTLFEEIKRAAYIKD